MNVLHEAEAAWETVAVEFCLKSLPVAVAGLREGDLVARDCVWRLGGGRWLGACAAGP